MTDDFRARLQQAWTEDHGRPPTWVEDLLLDYYAENMEAEMDRLIGDVTDWKPIGILGALSAATTIMVLPRRPETLEERVTRELVPLVRAAATEEQVEILRGEASIAALFAPEPTLCADGWAYGDLVKAQFLDMLDSWGPRGWRP